MKAQQHLFNLCYLMEFTGSTKTLTTLTATTPVRTNAFSVKLEQQNEIIFKLTFHVCGRNKAFVYELWTISILKSSDSKAAFASEP